MLRVYFHPITYHSIFHDIKYIPNHSKSQSWIRKGNKPLGLDLELLITNCIESIFSPVKCAVTYMVDDSKQLFK